MQLNDVSVPSDKNTSRKMKNDLKNDQFIKVPKLTQDMQLKPNSKALLEHIIMRAGAHGYCYESFRKIGKMIGISDKTVKNHFVILLRKKIIKEVEVKNYNFYSGLAYAVNEPSLWDVPSQKEVRTFKHKNRPSLASLLNGISRHHDGEGSLSVPRISAGAEVLHVCGEIKIPQGAEKIASRCGISTPMSAENYNQNLGDGYFLPISAKWEIDPVFDLDPLELNPIINKYRELENRQNEINSVIHQNQKILEKILEKIENIQEQQKKLEREIDIIKINNKTTMEEIMSIPPFKFMSKDLMENPGSLNGEEREEITAKEQNLNLSSTLEILFHSDAQICSNLNENKPSNTHIAKVQESAATAKNYPLKPKNKNDFQIASDTFQSAAVSLGGAEKFVSVVAVAKENSAPFVLADEKEMKAITSAKEICLGLKKVFNTRFIHTPFIGNVFKELHEVNRMSVFDIKTIKSRIMEHMNQEQEFFKEFFEPILFQNEGGFGEDSETSRHYRVFGKNLKDGFLNYATHWKNYEEKKFSAMKKEQDALEDKRKHLEETAAKEQEEKKKEEDEYKSKLSLLSSSAQEFVEDCESERKIFLLISMRKEIKCKTASEFEAYLSQTEDYKKWLSTKAKSPCVYPAIPLMNSFKAKSINVPRNEFSKEFYQAHQTTSLDSYQLSG